MPHHYAGFDIGGTKTLALVVSGAGEILWERRVARPRGPEETIDQLVDLTALMNERHEVGAIGVGIAGAISRAGSVQFSPNIPELVDFPLRMLLEQRFDVPVVVENDANMATWAEHRLGAGRDVDDLLYVALGTGIGTGFVLGGRLYRGAHGFAGESGHIVIDVHGDTHVSGVRGPWEMYASGSGLGALARRRAAAGDLPSVLDGLASADAVRGEHVTAAIASEAEDALALLDEFAALVAVGLTNLIYVLDPARIVLGGGLVDIGEPLRSRVDRRVAETTLGGALRPPVPVMLAELGSRAGALGAGLLAASTVEDSAVPQT